MKDKRPNSFKNEKGQLSIFLGVSMVVTVSMLAFVVNVGMFVKAKINLQNAVDAAAWSGAAVQARHLTRIGHLNWEIRNTYKEWMMKYYFLGQMGMEVVKNQQPTPNMNFRLKTFFASSSEPGYNPNAFDRFNAPTICIHFGSPHNICEYASIPGLPRFPSTGLANISEHHQDFLDNIEKIKTGDCTARSEINMGTAMTWAFGTKDGPVMPDLPQIAAQRVGAWPQSIELALRMRNLEMIMNRPPVENALCISGGGDCSSVGELNSQQTNILFNERPIKAFEAAYRNLGGGAFKKSDQTTEELSSSFKMTELKPKAHQVSENSLSGFLITTTSSTNATNSPLNKYYLDLEIYPVNLLTFYTTFVSGTMAWDPSIVQGGSCQGSKNAIPIPSYVFGFTKNPEVLTYYAIKGESKYIGLFYPFQEEDGVTIKAYAAAKPFGGKIGPKLFTIGTDGQMVQPRAEPQGRRTAPYLSGFDTSSFSGNYQAGLPIPISDEFYVSDANKVFGGSPVSGATVAFAIPNLLFDFTNPGDMNVHNTGTEFVVLTPANSIGTAATGTGEDKGLYNTAQFDLFVRDARAILAGASSAILSGPEIDEVLDKSRKPTKYEAMNFLIPTLDMSYQTSGANSSNLDTTPTAISVGTKSDGVERYQIYAPLFGVDTLYGDNIASISGIIDSYIDYQDDAIEEYMKAMKEVRNSILAANSSGLYQSAADDLYKDPLSISSGDCGSLSIAQKMNQFFRGDREECGILPLKEKITFYFNEQATTDPNYKDFFTTTYHNPDMSNLEVSSAYMPGPRQGAGNDGTMSRPFGNAAAPSGRRNFYSTKIFNVDKVRSSGTYPYEQISPYLERGNMVPPQDYQTVRLKNPLETGQLSEFRNFLF